MYCIYLFFWTMTAPSSPAASRVRVSSASSLLGKVVISTYGCTAGRDLDHRVRRNHNRSDRIVRIDEGSDVGDGLVVTELGNKSVECSEYQDLRTRHR